MKREKITITTDFIKLDQFLKLCGEAATGGGAKELIANGNALVNGEACLMRGKKLRHGDVIEINGKEFEILFEVSES